MLIINIGEVIMFLSCNGKEYCFMVELVTVSFSANSRTAV